jgi:hypothetical protein
MGVAGGVRDHLRLHEPRASEGVSSSWAPRGRVGSVASQTERRVFQGEVVPAADKLKLTSIIASSIAPPPDESVAVCLAELGGGGLKAATIARLV